MPLEFGNELKLQSAHALRRYIRQLRAEKVGKVKYHKILLGLSRVASVLRQSAHNPTLDSVHTLEVAQLGVQDTHEGYRAKDHKDKESE